MSSVVLVHGAWHGSWCWERVVPLLEERGLDVRTVDLPSVGADPGDTSGLAGDVAAVTAVLATLVFVLIDTNLVRVSQVDIKEYLEKLLGRQSRPKP